MGEAQLALGRIDEALEMFEKYRAVSREIAEKDPENTKAQRELGVSYYKMAEFHAALAGKEGATPAERLEHLREQRGWLERCLEVFAALRDRGTIWKSDAGVPEEMAAEIVQCDAEIADL